MPLDKGILPADTTDGQTSSGDRKRFGRWSSSNCPTKNQPGFARCNKRGCLINHEIAPILSKTKNLAVDVARQKVIFFGGEVNDGKFPLQLNDMWIWTNDNWTEVLLPNRPSRRSGSKMVYDNMNQVVVMFGGGCGGGLLDDTWIWNGKEWVNWRFPKLPLRIPLSILISFLIWLKKECSYLLILERRIMERKMKQNSLSAQSFGF